MSTTQVPVENNPPAATVEPASKPTTSTRPKQQPPHALILHNDRVNGFDWVVAVLVKVLRQTSGRAFWLTLRTHVGGRSVVWTGSLEVAELKAEQIRACGPDPRKRDAGAKPLRVSIEPLPG